LISGAIAYVDGAPAGFIVATDDPLGFMPKAMRQHWFRISAVLLKSALRNPRRSLALKEAIQIQRNLPTFPGEIGMGELLSFGVLPQYRSNSFVRQTSIHIGADLLHNQLRQLKAAGSRRVRAIVDKDNLAAQIFYRANGWRVGLQDVQGWSVPTMEFLLDLDH
jgi:ribosomal protein S18 acetylase RimI-like enzyme